jgi:hypothetical protein
MSWMDLSDYLVIEETAAARIDDLRDEAASRANVETPKPSRPAAHPVRVFACDWLRPASIEAP